MLLKIRTTLLFILFSYPLFSQTGTLIATVVCDDGIIIVSDSRAVIYDTVRSKQIPVAYIDSMNKIFKLNQFGIGIIGNSEFDCNFFNTIIIDFNSEFQQNPNVKTTFSAFKKYFYHRYPQEIYPAVTKNSFSGGGYFNGLPYIISFDSKRDLVQNSGIICNDSNATNYFTTYIKENPLMQRPTCLYISKILEKAIYKYIEKTNNGYHMGGPISVLKIDTNNICHYLQNDFSNRVYPDYGHFIREAIIGKIKLYPLVTDGVERAIIFLKASRCQY